MKNSKKMFLPFTFVNSVKNQGKKIDNSNDEQLSKYEAESYIIQEESSFAIDKRYESFCKESSQGYH